MKIQTELPEPLTERLETGSRVRFILQADHEIIRLTDHDANACRMLPSPLFNPQIENVVQKHVGHQRGQNRLQRYCQQRGDS